MRQVGISGIQKCPKHEGFFSASSESPQHFFQDFIVVFPMVGIFLGNYI